MDRRRAYHRHRSLRCSFRSPWSASDEPEAERVVQQPPLEEEEPKAMTSPFFIGSQQLPPPRGVTWAAILAGEGNEGREADHTSVTFLFDDNDKKGHHIGFDVVPFCRSGRSWIRCALLRASSALWPEGAHGPLRPAPGRLRRRPPRASSACSWQ